MGRTALYDVRVFFKIQASFVVSLFRQIFAHGTLSREPMGEALPHPECLIALAGLNKPVVWQMRSACRV
jgi:hypothetical protein